MFAFIIRRISQAVLVMLVISVIGFAIKQNVGDPVREITGISVSAAEREQLRDQLGLNDPFPVQWARFLGKAVQGDLGNSFYFKRPALEVILSKAPATLELVLATSIIIVLLSVPMGIYAAVKPKSWLSRFFMGASIVGVSIPVFLTAILLIYIFSVGLGWLPSYGRGQLVTLFPGWDTGFLTKDGLLHLVMPSLALTSIMLPLFIRLIRAEMKEVLESEYIKFAIAKGLRPWRVLLVHGFKNTLMPVITVGGVQLGTMIAFTILTETVFQWKGMGSMFIEAVERADSSLMVAYLVFVGFVFVTVNTVVDLIYGLVNPMVRVAGRK
ncbi:ABC-type dipeptide/oligopeptide/nickel transport system, permease component [Desulfocurvibacter africanus PCS]|uniref:ABC-type dipeptide/oligopeptide/nickel transport system, permease component n=1 Tax=Desulfocurvibacter africanus PCS TaxID=1262666 RepID=M5PTQ5_DESAF|nr:ABC transporter permease [Desulfocurvibacter africanus]EMG37459.1 ABC-type dipeptide/oligopeptide/nickel transport system, permease component [Desulfocurvibacter africanus PCS]